MIDVGDLVQLGAESGRPKSNNVSRARIMSVSCCRFQVPLRHTARVVWILEFGCFVRDFLIVQQSGSTHPTSSVVEQVYTARVSEEAVILQLLRCCMPFLAPVGPSRAQRPTADTLLATARFFLSFTGYHHLLACIRHTVTLD